MANYRKVSVEDGRHHDRRVAGIRKVECGPGPNLAGCHPGLKRRLHDGSGVRSSACRCVTAERARLPIE